MSSDKSSESEDDSESDNEDIVDVVEKVANVNLDGDFEKIVPFKFRRLSEGSSDEVDHEIAEILHEAQPLGKEVQAEAEKHQFELRTIPTEVEASTDIENSRFEVQVVSDEVQATDVELKASEEIEAEPDALEIEAATQTNETKDLTTEKPISLATEKTKFEATEPSISANKTVIDGELLPKASDECVKESADDKPPVPIQTYLWEDVKRSKEQVSGDNVCTSICSPATRR